MSAEIFNTAGLAKRLRCDQTPAWAALQASFDTSGKTFDLREAFAADPQRFGQFSQSAPHVFADLSKNLLDAATQTLLLELAQQCGLEVIATPCLQVDWSTTPKNVP